MLRWRVETLSRGVRGRVSTSFVSVVGFFLGRVMPHRILGLVLRYLHFRLRYYLSCVHFLCSPSAVVPTSCSSHTREGPPCQFVQYWTRDIQISRQASDPGHCVVGPWDISPIRKEDKRKDKILILLMKKSK